jgi:hypothetical protein
MLEKVPGTIYLCVEKSGTPFESVSNYQVPGPDATPDSSDRMWLDWSGMMATMLLTDRPMAIKMAVVSAYASIHEIEVSRLPADDFYALFPDSDPRSRG